MGKNKKAASQKKQTSAQASKKVAQNGTDKNEGSPNSLPVNQKPASTINRHKQTSVGQKQQNLSRPAKGSEKSSFTLWLTLFLVTCGVAGVGIVFRDDIQDLADTFVEKYIHPEVLVTRQAESTPDDIKQPSENTPSLDGEEEEDEPSINGSHKESNDVNHEQNERAETKKSFPNAESVDQHIHADSTPLPKPEVNINVKVTPGQKKEAPSEEEFIPANNENIVDKNKKHVEEKISETNEKAGKSKIEEQDKHSDGTKIKEKDKKSSVVDKDKKIVTEYGKDKNTGEEMAEKDKISGEDKVADKDKKSGKEEVAEKGKDKKSAEEEVVEIDKNSGEEKFLQKDKKSAEEKVVEKDKKSAEEKVVEKDKKSGEEKVLQKDKKSGEEKIVEKDKKSGEEKIVEKDKKPGEKKIVEKDKKSGEEKILEKDKKSGEEKIVEKDKKPGEKKIVEKDKKSGEEKILEKDKKSVGEKVTKEDKKSGEEKVVDKDKTSGAKKTAEKDRKPEESLTRKEVKPVDQVKTDQASEKSNYKHIAITNDEDFKIRADLDEADEFLEKENLEEAVERYDAILRKHTASPRAHYGKGQTLDKLGFKYMSNEYLERAIEFLARLLQLPNVPDELMKAAGRKLAERQQFRGWGGQSVKTFKFLVGRFPDDLELKKEFGVSYMMIGRNDRARDIFQEIIAQDPDNGFAKVHLGFIVKTQDNNLEKAVELLRDGIQSRAPGVDDGRFYLHLGDSLLRLGQVAEARKYYQEGEDKGLFLSAWQRSLYNVDGLTGRPWWTMEQTGNQKYLQVLQDNWKIIRQEGLAQLNAKTGSFLPEDENLRDTGDWKQFTLYQQGRRKDENCAKAPKTCELIDRFPDAKGCKRGQVKFSVMSPGIHVWPHVGPTNCRIRAHLGLVVPEGPVIRVVNETRTWKEGRFIIFDDSFEHEVWHEGSELRLVLIVDFWHPELTESQKRRLSPI